MSVEIFNGTLDAGTQGDWVEVPEAVVYSVTWSNASMDVQFSLDGVNLHTFPSQIFKQVGPQFGAPGQPIWQLLNVPVKYMRLSNRDTTNPQTGTAYTIGV